MNIIDIIFYILILDTIVIGDHRLIFYVLFLYAMRQVIGDRYKTNKVIEAVVYITVLFLYIIIFGSFLSEGEYPIIIYYKILVEYIKTQKLDFLY